MRLKRKRALIGLGVLARDGRVGLERAGLTTKPPSLLSMLRGVRSPSVFVSAAQARTAKLTEEEAMEWRKDIIARLEKDGGDEELEVKILKLQAHGHALGQGIHDAGLRGKAPSSAWRRACVEHVRWGGQGDDEGVFVGKVGVSALEHAMWSCARRGEVREVLEMGWSVGKGGEEVGRVDALSCGSMLSGNAHRMPPRTLTEKEFEQVVEVMLGDDAVAKHPSAVLAAALAFATVGDLVLAAELCVRAGEVGHVEQARSMAGRVIHMVVEQGHATDGLGVAVYRSLVDDASCPLWPPPKALRKALGHFNLPHADVESLHQRICSTSTPPDVSSSSLVHSDTLRTLVGTKRASKVDPDHCLKSLQSSQRFLRHACTIGAVEVARVLASRGHIHHAARASIPAFLSRSTSPPSRPLRALLRSFVLSGEHFLAARSLAVLHANSHKLPPSTTSVLTLHPSRSVPNHSPSKAIPWLGSYTHTLSRTTGGREDWHFATQSLPRPLALAVAGLEEELIMNRGIGSDVESIMNDVWDVFHNPKIPPTPSPTPKARSLARLTLHLWELYQVATSEPLPLPPNFRDTLLTCSLAQEAVWLDISTPSTTTKSTTTKQPPTSSAPSPAPPTTPRPRSELHRTVLFHSASLLADATASFPLQLVSRLRRRNKSPGIGGGKLVEEALCKHDFELAKDIAPVFLQAYSLTSKVDKKAAPPTHLVPLARALVYGGKN